MMKMIICRLGITRDVDDVDHCDLAFLCIMCITCSYYVGNGCIIVWRQKKVTRTEPANWRNFPQFVIKIPKKKLFLMIHTCSLGCLSFYFCCNVAPLTSCKQYEHQQHHHHLLHMLLYENILRKMWTRDDEASSHSIFHVSTIIMMHVAWQSTSKWWWLVEWFVGWGFLSLLFFSFTVNKT